MISGIHCTRAPPYTLTDNAHDTLSSRTNPDPDLAVNIPPFKRSRFRTVDTSGPVNPLQPMFRCKLLFLAFSFSNDRSRGKTTFVYLIFAEMIRTYVSIYIMKYIHRPLMFTYADKFAGVLIPKRIQCANSSNSDNNDIMYIYIYIDTRES